MKFHLWKHKPEVLWWSNSSCHQLIFKIEFLLKHAVSAQLVSVAFVVIPLLGFYCLSITWKWKKNFWSCHVHGNCKIRIAVVPSKYEADRRSSLIHVMRLMIIQVMRCAILDQTLINGVWMVGEKSVSLNPFAWYSNSYLTLNHSHGM